MTAKIDTTVEPQPEPPRMSYAGMAGSDADLRAVRRERDGALVVWSIPLILLLVALYWRLAVSSAPLRLGVFTWIYPLAVVAVIGALLWALVVVPNSRGDALGDHLRAGQQIDDDSTRRDDDLLGAGKRAVAEGREAGALSNAALTQARDEINQHVELFGRGRQLAATTFGLTRVPPLRDVNLIHPSLPHYDRIQNRLNDQYTRQYDLVPALEDAALPVLASNGSPHALVAEPTYLPADPRYVDPAIGPGYPRSTLLSRGAPPDPAPASRSFRRWIILALALVAALLMALGVWLFGAHHSPPSSAPAAPATTTSTPAGVPPRLVAAHPAVPTGLHNGLDFRFIDPLPGGGQARWSCSTPITVRLAGPAPAGAEATMESAVHALQVASELPLRVGTPMAKPVTNANDVPPGTITYTYLTDAQIAKDGIKLSDDTLGEGGPTIDSSGRITAGRVIIRAQAASPATTLGKEVAWHEGGHAVGLGHSRQITKYHEIMEPTTDGIGPVAWGPGDRYALAEVGRTTTE